MNGRDDDFHEALKNDPLRRKLEMERELARLFDEWRALPLPRPDFFDFAHHKRKASRA